MRLTIYSRSECHMSRDMLYQLSELLPVKEVLVEVVDIDGDEDLAKLYGLKVPVLMAGQDEICHYHLDRQALESYLNNHS